MDLYRSAAAALPNDPVIQSNYGLAFLYLGRRQSASGDNPGAHRSYAQAARMFDGVLARNPSDRAAVDGSSGTQEELSRLLTLEGDYPGAIEQSSKAVGVTRRMLAAEPANPDRLDALASSLGQLAVSLQRNGEVPKAADNYRQVVELREQLAQRYPQNARFRRPVMLAAAHLGEVLGYPYTSNLGDFTGARIQFQRMLDIAESATSGDAANKTAPMDLAEAQLRMGGLLEASEPQVALRHFQAALKLLTQLPAADPDTVAFQASRGLVESRIGAILVSEGRSVEGMARLSSALEITRALQKRQPKNIDYAIIFLMSASDMARALARTHNRAGLDALAEETVHVLERLHGARVSSFTAARRPRTQFAVGEAYELMKARPQACEWFHQSVEAWREIEASSGIVANQRALQAGAVRGYAACGGAVEALISSGAKP